MNPVSRLIAHAQLRWQDYKGRYDQQLAEDCHRLLAEAKPLSGIWIDALRTARKLDPAAADALDTIADSPLLTRSANRLTFLLAYLMETGREAQAIRLFDNHHKRLQDLTDQNPALCWLANRDRPDDERPPLARLFQHAAETRSRFENWVADTNHRITLLANGPIEEDPQLPDNPDHLIIDFNQPSHGITLPANSPHAWVRTPNNSVSPRTDKGMEWVIFTGNNSLYQRIRLAPLLAADFAPEKYLFVPDRIWLELVNELKASPSAGLIMLHWIASLRGGLDGIQHHGYSIVPGQQRLNDKPGRHRWQLEREFLHRWMKA